MAIKTVDIGSVIATDNIITKIQDKLPLGFVKRVDLNTTSVKFTVKKQPNVLTERFHVVFYGQNTASLETHFFTGFSNRYIFNSPYGSCGSAIKVRKREIGDNIEFIISPNATTMIMLFRNLHVNYIPPYELNPEITSDFEEFKIERSWAPQ